MGKNTREKDDRKWEKKRGKYDGKWEKICAMEKREGNIIRKMVENKGFADLKISSEEKHLGLNSKIFNRFPLLYPKLL